MSEPDLFPPEQMEAAAQHALANLDRHMTANGGAITASDSFSLDHGPDIGNRVRQRVVDSMGTDQWGWCEHLIRRPAQPMYVRMWKFKRFTCFDCTPVLLQAPRQYPCEGCGVIDPPGGLLLMIMVLDIVTVYFGICHACQAIVDKQLTKIRRPDVSA